jgi:DNA mismatch repair protein MutH
MATYSFSDSYYIDASQLPYDDTSAIAILEFAMPLTGKTLRDFLQDDERDAVMENRANKGDLGNLVEKYYFRINPGNSPQPDFPKAGVELKTTAVEPKSKRALRKIPIDASKYQAKERLKLASINYHTIDKETWQSNSVFKKCRNILLLVSLYDSEASVYDRKFVAEPFLWQIPKKDIEIIQRDWEIIHDKVREGKAQDISCTDTYYLEATTSGSGKFKSQPYSNEPAKERSFALKASYVTAAMLETAKYVRGLEPILGEHDLPNDLENIIVNRANIQAGKTVDELLGTIGLGIGESKQRLSLLSNRILGFQSRRAEELVKAGIEMKSVNLRSNGTPQQDISFPAFSYTDIVKEDWEDSTFKQKLDCKILFMVYQTDTRGICRFKEARFWNMPQDDLEEAHRVWEETKRRISNDDANNLPKKDFSVVAHVRNHGRTSRPEHRVPSPTNGMLPVKGFWLNQKYVGQQLQ